MEKCLVFNFSSKLDAAQRHELEHIRHDISKAEKSKEIKVNADYIEHLVDEVKSKKKLTKQQAQ